MTGEVAQGVLQGLVPDALLERAGANRITGVAGDVLLPSLPADATQVQAETTASANIAAMSGVKIEPKKMSSRIDISQQALAMSAGSFDAVVAAQFRRHSGALIDQEFFKNVIADKATTYMKRKEDRRRGNRRNHLRERERTRLQGWRRERHLREFRFLRIVRLHGRMSCHRSRFK